VEQAALQLTSQQIHDDLLDIDDVIGKRIVTTRLHHSITVREENALAALEVMSRFAANPKWVIYLPPTMSPTETTSQPGLLEHPAEAFGYFRREGVPRVVCEEKHMGSRAVVIVCRDEDAVRRGFGVVGEGIGICYTRTGRRFFDAPKNEREFLEKVQAAVGAAGFWDEFKTDWVCLDAELMPRSAKAQELLRQQYAAVGAAAQASLAEAVTLLERLASGNGDAAPLTERCKQRLASVNRYVDSYRRYCWPVQSVNDLKLAPFHLLSTEGHAHTQHDHVWHMEKLAELSRASDGLLVATPYKQVDVTDAASVEDAICWWTELTSRVLTCFTKKDRQPPFSQNGLAIPPKEKLAMKRHSEQAVSFSWTDANRIARAVRQLADLDEERKARYVTLFILAAATGLRCSELFALRMNDIDFKAGTIRVDEAFDSRTCEVGLCKNVKAYRTVFLGDSEGREALKILEAFVGDRVQNSGEYVFHSRRGSPLRETKVLHEGLHPALKALGLPRAGLHAFRRGCNRRWNLAGMNGAVLRQQMGHSSEAMTAHYTGQIPLDQIQAAFFQLNGVSENNGKRESNVSH
jgi:integrase